MRSHPAHPRQPSYSLSKTRRKKQTQRRFPFLTVALLALLMGAGTRQVFAHSTPPQAVLVLGGATEREKFAAQFAQEHPNLPIWISSGSNPEFSEWVFEEAGIAPDRIHRDYEAVDTVTNFTTLVDDFKARGITSIYLITSDNHMRRAWVIGEIVMGSQGIDIKTVAVPSGLSAESLDKVVRDAARSVLWITTGNTGIELARWIKNGQFPATLLNLAPAHKVEGSGH